MTSPQNLFPEGGVGVGLAHAFRYAKTVGSESRPTRVQTNPMLAGNVNSW